MISPQAEASSTPSRPPPKPARCWTNIHLIIYFFILGSLANIIIGLGLFIFLTIDIPDISSLSNYTPSLTTTILDKEGRILDRVFKENRYLVTIDKLPELLPKAFIAAEDARFFEHRGVDFLSILRAFIANVRKGGMVQGGSTITQQVTRSLLLSPEKTYSRKIKEAILAYRIDANLSKDQILYLYLNQIYLGEGAYGVEAGALTYFGKHVLELGLAEIAMLAGLPQAPSRYSPLKHYDSAKKRQAYVLNRMADEGFISPAEAQQAYDKILLWAPVLKSSPDYEYFLQYIHQHVRKKYGEELLFSGGLTIFTTLDPTMQDAAVFAVQKGVEELVKRHKKDINPEPAQAALLCMEVTTGAVRAMAGGTSFSKSQFNRALQARRQPGSAFKPIIYATALERGISPMAIIMDEPIALPSGVPGEMWIPQNYDGKFKGPTPLRTALIQSRNIVTIKLLQQVGIDRVVKMAKRLGIRSHLFTNLSLALGSSEVSLLELTAAYGAMANQGNYVEPLFITKIVDRTGKVIEENRPELRPAIDSRTAYQMTSILQDVIQEGTGKGARGLDLPAAGKTGTTDKNMDAWFIGYTPMIATGVWVGYDKKESLGKDETGGKAAVPIWLDFMKTTTVIHPLSVHFEIPQGITTIPIDPETGEYAGNSGIRTVQVVFKDEQLPLVRGFETSGSNP